MDFEKLNARLSAIEFGLKELTRAVREENIIAPATPIADLARKVAGGDMAALRAHNKKRYSAGNSRWL